MSHNEANREFLYESQSISGLLENNEELTARITAALYKNSELEKRLRETEFTNQELSQRAESLSEQILILQEKDRLQKDRLAKVETRLRTLAQEQELQEIRFSELMSTAQVHQQKFHETKNMLVKKIRFLYRFRCWVRDHLYKSYREKSLEIQKLRVEYKTAQEALYKCQLRIEDQNNTLAHQEVRLKTDWQTIQDLQDKYLKLKEERTVHLNRLVAADRTRDEAIDRYKKEFSQWQESLSQQRQEAKLAKAEALTATQKAQALGAEVQSLTRETNASRSQIENMQQLWSENHEQIEKMLARETALQKLNQELSQQINQARTTINDLKRSLLQMTGRNSLRLDSAHEKIRLISANPLGAGSDNGALNNGQLMSEEGDLQF